MKALWFLLTVWSCLFTPVLKAASPELEPWLSALQPWERDTDGPILTMGAKGDFCDTHIFPPMVALEQGQYRLWYCGSTNAVEQRVFQLGLAQSPNVLSETKRTRPP